MPRRLLTLSVMVYLMFSKQSFADQHGLTLLETSASDGTNVEQAFVRLATEIKRMVDLSPPPEDSRKKTDCHKCHIS